jgi:hypothetical protein
MNVVLPVGGAAAGYGLTNALVDDASTGMKIGGAGLGAAAALITSLYLQNMDKGTVPADAPPVKPSEKAEQELKDVAGGWTAGEGLATVAGGLGLAGTGYLGLKGLQGAGGRVKDLGAKLSDAAVSAGAKTFDKAVEGVPWVFNTATGLNNARSVGEIGKEVSGFTEEGFRLRDIIKLIKKVKKVKK